MRPSSGRGLVAVVGEGFDGQVQCRAGGARRLVTDRRVAEVSPVCVRQAMQRLDDRGLRFLADSAIASAINLPASWYSRSGSDTAIVAVGASIQLRGPPGAGSAAPAHARVEGVEQPVAFESVEVEFRLVRRKSQGIGREFAADRIGLCAHEQVERRRSGSDSAPMPAASRSAKGTSILSNVQNS